MKPRMHDEGGRDNEELFFRDPLGKKGKVFTYLRKKKKKHTSKKRE